MYKNDMERLRMSTSLKLFCEVQPLPLSLVEDPPPDFKKMVVEFKWPETVTLEAVERFRQCYARHYRLNECAMIVNSIRPSSFIVTWFVPISIIETFAREGKKFWTCLHSSM